MVKPEKYYWELPWKKSLSMSSSFCKAVVSAGYLTWQQMLDAVCRFRLGGTRQGGVIFWQINHEGRICDGKVMYYLPDCHRNKEQTPTWVSAMLTQRHGGKCEGDFTRHCFFGLHLLTEKHAWLLPPSAGTDFMAEEGKSSITDTIASSLPPIAIVEAEKTAVILSAHYPRYLWLASGGLGEVQSEKFRPLQGRDIILFPDTDPDGKAYKHWYQAAQEVMAAPWWQGSPPIRVSAILEQHATPDQKQRKIDLADFLTEKQK